MLQDAQPALILLDLMLPRMDGFEFLHALRADARWKDIPVLVVTAKDLSAEERDQLARDAELVIRKGAIDRETLLSEVSRRVAARVKSAEAAPQPLPAPTPA